MSGTARRVREVLVSRFADWYGIAPEDVTDDRPFAEYGLTSRDSVVLTVLLGRAVGRELPATLLWDTPTPAALIAALTALEEPGPPTAEEATAAALPPDAPSSDALPDAALPAAGSPAAACPPQPCPPRGRPSPWSASAAGSREAPTPRRRTGGC